MATKNYWERLKVFKLYSIQRRNERYKILYIWKSLNGLVPTLGLEWHQNSSPRYGPILKVDKIKVPATKKAVRLTQITGSMEGSKILELREQAELALKEKEKVKERKKQDKKGQCESFLKCKLTCICDSIVCDATGLKQCIVCQDVLKSQCTKSKCKVDGIKPQMIMCHFDIEKK